MAPEPGLRRRDDPGGRSHQGAAEQNASNARALGGHGQPLARAPASRPPLPAAIPPFHRPSDPPNRDPNWSAALRAVVLVADRTPHPRADGRFPRTGRDGDPADHGTGPTDRSVPPSLDVTDGGGATTVPAATPATQSPRHRTPASTRTPPSSPPPPHNGAHSWHPSGRESAQRSRSGKRHCAFAAGRGCDGRNGDRPPANGAGGAAPDSCGGCSPETGFGPH